MTWLIVLLAVEQNGDRRHAEAAQAVRIGVDAATIDDQRQAIQNYRSLFDELLISRADLADDAAESGAERAEHDVS
jgi:hypothetical protein